MEDIFWGKPVLNGRVGSFGNWRAWMFSEMNRVLGQILKDDSMAEFQIFFDIIKSPSDIKRTRPDTKSGVSAPIEIIGQRDAFLNFIDGNNGRKMITSQWISRFEVRQLKWLYEAMLVNRFTAYHLTDTIVDRQISASKRALLCHAIFDGRDWNLWWYSRSHAGNNLIDFKNREEYPVVGRICLSPKISIRRYVAMLEWIADDKCALFEMNRQLEGMRITDPLLQLLLRNNAAQCFAYWLSHYPKQVFKFRTPSEWLLTVCRCTKEKTAIAAVNEIERQFPGIVASVRDPWGNTLLWNTFVNESPTEALQAELIRLGCDPNAENEWGLSYQLLKDNDPEKISEQEMEVSHAV